MPSHGICLYLQLGEPAVTSLSDLVSEATTMSSENFTNQTIGHTSGKAAHFEIPTATLIMVSLYSLICLIGLVGNGLVIFVVLRYHRLKTVTNIYILNLSVADGLFLICIPMLVTTGITKYWIFGYAMCKVFYILTCINMFTSAFTLTVMAIDRYLAACHPIRSLTYRTPRYALLGILIIWSLSFFVMLPIIMYAETTGDGKYKSCNIVWPEKQQVLGYKVYMQYTMVTAFVVPVFLICTFYTMIIVRLKQGGPGRIAHRRHCQFRKATSLVTLIIIVFIICWLPYWAYQLDIVSHHYTSPLKKWKFVLYQIFTFLSYANSMLNPLLYAFTNEYFRDAFRGAFHCLPEELLITSRRTSALQCIESGNICQQLEARFDSNGKTQEQQHMVTTVTSDDVTANHKIAGQNCIGDISL